MKMNPMLNNTVWRQDEKVIDMQESREKKNHSTPLPGNRQKPLHTPVLKKMKTIYVESQRSINQILSSVTKRYIYFMKSEMLGIRKLVVY
jgi:hypothetical protein